MRTRRVRFTKVSRLHERVAAHLLRRAFGQLLTLVHHDHVIRQVHHQLDIVFDQQDAQAFGRQATDQRLGVVRVGVTHALGWLVEQQHARAGGQRHRDFEPALLAVRQETGQLVRLVLQRKTFDQFVHPRQRRAAVRHAAQQTAPAFDELRCQPQVLAHRQFEEQVGDLERARQAGGQHAVGACAGQVGAVEAHAAGAGPDGAADQVEQAALARAVRPDDGGDAAALCIEADAVDGDQRTETHRQAAYFQDRAHEASLRFQRRSSAGAR